MKIVLKDADFSQTGIPVPFEITLKDGYSLQTIDGKQGSANVDRCYGQDFIPVENSVLKNLGTTVRAAILFYSSDDENDYVGVAGYTIYISYEIASGDSLDITSLNDFVDGSGNTISKETLFATATHYRITILHSATGVEFVAEKDS